MVRKSSTPEAVAPQAPAKRADATVRKLDRLPGIQRDGYSGSGEAPPPQEDVGTTVKRLRKIQADTAKTPAPIEAPKPVAATPKPATETPKPVTPAPEAAKAAPAVAPAGIAPVAQAPVVASGNRIVDQPAFQGGGWKSPQTDGGWRSPTTDAGGPSQPAVWSGDQPAGAGPGVLAPPPPPTYYPAQPTYYPTPTPPVYPDYPTYPTGGGYQSPRSDGGYSSPSSGSTVGTTSRSSGSSSKDEALIVGGVLAAVGLFGGALIGTSLERQIGAQAASEALRKYPVYRGDQRVQQYVQGVVDRLAANRQRKDVKYEVRVVESSEPNAFAVPGGYMFITTAALKQMRNEAELAGVMGHEMEHVEKRHGIKTLQTQLVGMGVAIAALGQTDSQAMQTAGAVALGLAMQGFSREHEMEADAGGARLASKAGYDPRGLVSFLGTIKQRESPKVELLSDHPDTEKRIKALNSQIQKESLLTVQMENGEDRYNQQVYWLRRGY